jgi:hypothetical protein
MQAAPQACPASTPASDPPSLQLAAEVPLPPNQVSLQDVVDLMQ